MGPRTKVIALPEKQFLGALERALEGLSGEVERALAELEGRRSWRDQADEAQRTLAKTRRVARRAHGIRSR
jgi:hypothetical protein